MLIPGLARVALLGFVVRARHGFQEVPLHLASPRCSSTARIGLITCCVDSRRGFGYPALLRSAPGRTDRPPGPNGLLNLTGRCSADRHAAASLVEERREANALQVNLPTGEEDAVPHLWVKKCQTTTDDI